MIFMMDEDDDEMIDLQSNHEAVQLPQRKEPVSIFIKEGKAPMEQGSSIHREGAAGDRRYKDF